MNAAQEIGFVLGGAALLGGLLWVGLRLELKQQREQEIARKPLRRFHPESADGNVSGGRRRG